MNHPSTRFRAGRRTLIAIALALSHVAVCCFASQSGAPSENLIAKSEQAKQALLDKRFEEAIQLYSELVKAMPGEAGLLLNLGLAQHSAGQYEGAIPTFRAVLDAQPENFPALFVLGVCLLKTDRPDEAIPFLDRAVRRKPDHHLARFELADALLSAGRFGEAAGHFRRLVKAEASDPRLWYGLGVSYMALSRETFRRLEDLAPESGYWYALLARSRTEQQQYRSAYYYYRRALEKNPTLRGLHGAIAEIYTATGSPEWAAEELKREEEIPRVDCRQPSPECSFHESRYLEVIEQAAARKDPEALYWLTRAYSEAALDALRRVEALPESAVVHELRAEVYRMQDRHQDSVREWREALRLAPRDRHIKKELARSLGLNQEFEPAIPILKELLAEAPRSPDILLMLGDSYLQLQEPLKAVSHLEAAFDEAPDWPAVRSTLGRAYLQIGDSAKAIPHLEASLDEDRDGNLHYLLGQAYLRSGKRDAALAMIAKSQELRTKRKEESEERDQAHQITPP